LREFEIAGMKKEGGMRFRRATHRTWITILASAVVVVSIGLIGYNQGFTSLQVSQTLDNSHIFVKGSNASPEVSTVNLRLDAPQPTQRLTADVMLVVDRSASFPVEKAVDSAKRIIDNLDSDDRVGLVSFATDATLETTFTPANDAGKVKDALDKLVADGKTALGEGMAVATDELSFHGRPNVAWIEILLTDGRSNYGRDPLQEAQKANDDNVIIYSIGVGSSINQGLMTDIAQATGGKFYFTYSDSIVDEILRLNISAHDPVATNIQITETISKNFKYEAALQNGPNQIINNSDGTTTLRWSINQLLPTDSWITQYTISGSTIGIFNIHQSPSVVDFKDARGHEYHNMLQDLNLEVRPKPPALTADFKLDPSEPTTFDAIQFTDQSTVERGSVVSWLWDFGDGTTSTTQNPVHRYRADGAYRVIFTVKSDVDVEASSSLNLTVYTPAVSVRRTINTYLPIDETIPDQTFEVTLDIRINATINGLGIDEDLPSIDSSSTWSATAIDNSTAEFLSSKTQWLFSEILKAGDERKIIYDVTVPNAQKLNFVTGTLSQTYAITGKITSASPPIAKDNNVKGESQIKILRGFPIEIIVAHYDTNTGKLDLKQFPTHKISQSQIDQARMWWRNATPVLSSEDATGQQQVIDLAMMNRLTAYFLTQTSVFDPLPSE
jgi:Mg-chelatase subunit ChlD